MQRATQKDLTLPPGGLHHRGMGEKRYEVAKSVEDTAEIESFEANPLWDRNVEGSVVSLLPAALAQRFEDARFENPDLFDRTEEDLTLSLGRRPSATENQLRLRFWYELELSRSDSKIKFSVSRVCAGVCSVSAFYSYTCRPETLAWLACPPMAHDTHIEEMLNFGASEMRRLMALDTRDPVTLKENTKLWGLKVQLYLAAEARKMGAVVETTKNLNITADARQVQGALEASGDEATQRRIEEMQRAETRRLNPPRDPNRAIIEPEDV